MKGLHTVYSMTPSTLRPLTWVRKTPPKTPSNDEEMDDTSARATEEGHATDVMCTDQNNTVKNTVWTIRMTKVEIDSKHFMNNMEPGGRRATSGVATTEPKT